MVDMRGSVRAPEFAAGLDWLNVERPLRLADLRGKFVLLDFWTYCCINCLHILPELAKLESQFSGILEVIGVHAAKYTEEQVTQNVRQAVIRHGIVHPVVNDRSHIIWDSYAVSAWPTVALIDPDGRLVGEHPGEFTADQFTALISELAKEFDAQGKLKREPIPLSLERDREPSRTLAYPGKVLADEGSSRLFISDTAHHRVLVTDLGGRVQDIIGTGEPGLSDGDFSTSSFRGPQGLAVDGDLLYIADTENHSVRRADLNERRVERVAGTGEQLRLSRRGGPALDMPLNSPWDLAIDGDQLYIAMAGNHQIWALDIPAGEVHRIAGTGREALHDADLMRCALAQPSGLSLSGRRLYFADSETSSIRVADFESDQVTTLAGQGLFVFGDVDGIGPDIRLQHPLGVAYHNGVVYIADTYNSKIKQIDPGSGQCSTFLGKGYPGCKDGTGEGAAFWEPGGLSIMGNRMYIADTNNHAIRVADLMSGSVSTLSITG